MEWGHHEAIVNDLVCLRGLLRGVYHLGTEDL
ncbi:hypothetical protein PR003_g30600 [Phytophthora rubi]|uniref:Uncharacterized protein n=1 Tax=Phytophthora rubi TaxID=129364 RepID=A0A6A4BE77_9STRA|nr:hypothetical protein PR003_g30600 [Phytophthora rubi]